MGVFIRDLGGFTNGLAFFPEEAPLYLVVLGVLMDIYSLAFVGERASLYLPDLNRIRGYRQ